MVAALYEDAVKLSQKMKKADSTMLKFLEKAAKDSEALELSKVMEHAIIADDMYVWKKDVLKTLAVMQGVVSKTKD